MAATKKSMWVLIGLFIITAWLLGFVIEVQAETMKCRSSGNTVKREVIRIPDVEGHTITIGMRDGLAIFEDGEVASYKAFSASDTIPGKGGRIQVYALFTFVDGSTIITSCQQVNEPDPEGKFAQHSKIKGEIIKGTIRFEGIKGSISGEGKQVKAEKGELAGKSTFSYIFTYTLPSR
jgi:hypothetical protein